jgi:hypothetical protein
MIFCKSDNPARLTEAFMLHLFAPPTSEFKTFINQGLEFSRNIALIFIAEIQFTFSKLGVNPNKTFQLYKRTSLPHLFEKGCKL